MAEIKIEKIAGGAAKVGKVFAKKGDAINVGDKLFLLEAGKINTPFKSTVAGTVSEIKVATGDKVKVGDIVAVVD
ncbi:MAG: biotin/lipoyl-containing protein [Clostridia bacterium]